MKNDIGILNQIANKPDVHLNDALFSRDDLRFLFNIFQSFLKFSK